MKHWPRWWFLRFLPHSTLSNSLNKKYAVDCSQFGLHSDTQLAGWLAFLTRSQILGGCRHNLMRSSTPPTITSWSQCNYGSRAMGKAAVPLPFICAPHVCKKHLLSTFYLELVLSVTFGNKRTFTAKFRMVLNFIAFLICIQICVSWISLWSCWQHMTFWFWDRLIRRCIVIKLLTTHFRELRVNK